MDIDRTSRRDTPSVTSFLDQLLHVADPDRYIRVALVGRAGDDWRGVTYGQLEIRSRALAGHLARLGVVPGDRVAIVGESSPDWVMAFLAAVLIGAVAVPVDPKLTDFELGPILNDAGPVVALCSASVLQRSALQGSGRLLADDVASLRHVLPLADAWIAAGPDRHAAETDATRSMSDPAVIVYTSGTTGRAKGVTLTYANLASQVEAAVRLQRLTGDEVFLSILPLSHTFELTCGLLGVLASGGRIAYSGSLLPDQIASAMVDQQATAMMVVPLFLKLLKSRVERQLAKAPRAARGALGAAGSLAAVWPNQSARRILARPVLHRFGGRLRAFYVGGAPLDPEVAEFFVRLGISVYEGYGLTETSPIVAMNAPGCTRLGSVGRPMPGIDVRIDRVPNAPAGEGEVLVKGPNVMLGYHRQPEATRETIDAAGWLRSGDLGHVDDDGYLWITGRSKNVIVLPNGKNVQAEEVEAVLEQSSLIREVCVLGTRATGGLADGGEEVHAVVVPSEEAIGSHTEAELQPLVEREVRRLATQLAAYKHPRSVTVSLQELPKTATRKVRRNEVAALVATESATVEQLTGRAS